MAPKRKVQDAFGKTNGQLSAVAAARLAKQRKEADTAVSISERATGVEATVYDDQHEDLLESGLKTEREDFIAPQTDPPDSTIPLSYYDIRLVDQDDESGFKVTLQAGQTVTVIGEYDLQVLKGTVSVYGAAFQARSGLHRVYAPTSHAVPQVIARKDQTVIKLHPVQSCLRKLETLSSLYRGLWPKGDRSFTVHRTSAEDTSRTIIPIEVDQAVEDIISKLCGKAHAGDSPHIMAAGSKSCGKSTLNRHLVNSLLTRTQRRKCYYLDLDPGQPEFGPPGTLALIEVTAPVLGPPSSHLASRHCNKYRLIRSHALAATSFKDDPDHYLACAKDLIRYAKSSIPIVVNSCGWVSGLGGTVLIELGSVLGITDMIVHNPFEDSIREQVGPYVEVHDLVRRQPKPSSRSPAETRAMLTMSYFHQRLRQDHRIWKGHAIDTWNPWTVSFDEAGDGIYAVLSYGQLPQAEFLSEILDGSIVALLAQVGRTDDMARQITPEGLPYILPGDQGYCEPLSPSSTECVGLAVVRGIDAENKELHLVTPLAEDEIANIMQQRVLLVRGAFDPADWAYLESLYLNPEDAEPDRPWISRKELVGVEGAVWRLRHPPLASATLSRR